MSGGRGRRGGGVAPRGIRVLGVSSMLLLLLSLSLLLLLPSALCEGATETTTPTMTMAATAAASTGEELPAGEEEEETTPEATATPPPLAGAASTGTASAAAAGATAATTGSATASSSAATAATAATAASPSAPGLYYSDAPPPLPFNPWQALTIQEHEALTRVVDGFLRLTGEAGAQPTRVPPGPLVDQPELRRPGQRWQLPQLPQLLSAEQRQQQQAVAAAARARARDAADGAQAAAMRAGTLARNAARGAANATSDLLMRWGRRGPGDNRNASDSTGSSANEQQPFASAAARLGLTTPSAAAAATTAAAAAAAAAAADVSGTNNSSRPLPADLFGGLASGLSPDAAAAALAAGANAAANATAAALPQVPPSSRDFFDRLRSNSSTRRRRRGVGNGSNSSMSVSAAAALRSNSTNAASGGDNDEDNNPFAAAADALSDAAPPPPLVGASTTPAAPGQLPHLAFAGSGALFLFYAGVSEGLVEKGLFQPGISRTSAISGGALVATLVSSGMNPRKILEYYEDSTIVCNMTLLERWSAPPNTPVQAVSSLRSASKECLRTAAWPGDSVANAVMRYVTPESIANISRTTQIWGTEISPYLYYAQRSAPLGPYRDVDDLALKIKASCAIPCFTTPYTYLEVDGRPYVDGGFSASTNQLCINATADSPCVTVSATHFGPHGWSPFMRPDNPFGWRTCDDSVLVPPVYGLQARPPIGYGPPFNIPVNTSSLLPDGSLTTRPHRCSLPEMLDLMVLRDRQALPPPGFPGWAINPGKRTPMPEGISTCDFLGYLMRKANSTIARAIFEHGRNEAIAFAAEVYGK